MSPIRSVMENRGYDYSQGRLSTFSNKGNGFTHDKVDIPSFWLLSLIKFMLGNWNLP
jgi:hypothetical protein